MKNLQVLFLAGGIGKRMWPLTIVKSLIPFCGRPIISYIFDDFKKAGIVDFKFVVRQENLPEFKKLFVKENVLIKFYIQKEPKGMADGVLSVKDLKNKPLLIVNPEDFLESGLPVDFIKSCFLQKPDFMTAGIYQKNYFPGGYLVFKGKKLTKVVEKPGEGNNPSFYVKLVFDYFKNPVYFIDCLKKTASRKDDIYEQAINKIIKKSQKALVYKYQGFWQSLKYPWHILEMMELIFKRKLKTKVNSKPEIHPKAIIEGPVCFEEGVKVLANAVIKGPSYIGRNTLVGTGALVRDSNIGENCLIGFNSEICRSWVGSDCWFHRNYIGDSVLEKNISFGAGALTANFRLDQKEILVKRGSSIFPTRRTKFGAVIGQRVRVGVNASLMPGVLVGSNSFVGPGAVLSKNLEENKKAYLARKSIIFK